MGSVEVVTPIDIPIIIIGGGAAGLNLSIFLSNYGIQHVLFEKHSGTSILPKAHYINQRTIEIFRQHGIAGPIVAAGCPPGHMSSVEFRTSLGGPGPFDGKLIGKIDAFGGGASSKIYKQDSPVMATNLPLLRSEPIFRAIAEEKNPGGILFAHGVTDFINEESHVLVTVQPPAGPPKHYRCQYLIAADAGKLSHGKLDITMEGLTNLACMASVHFKADLSKYHNGRALITHFMSSSATTSASYAGGALVPMGPTWGSHSEEWSLHFGFPPGAPVPTDSDFLVSRAKELLNVPDVDLEVLQSSQWIFDRVVANKFSRGRCFIVGDAAHRIPPAGGLGMNTAIEDALNLAFKLSLVLKGAASPKLLTTYESERRPIALQNADWGLFCLSNFPVIQAAVGLQPGNTPYNSMRMGQLFSPSFSGKAALNALRRVILTQDIEFQARNIELGFQYDSIAESASSSGSASMTVAEPEARDLTGKQYHPTTKPGSRLPHAWLKPTESQISNAAPTSTQDLLRLCQSDFLLLSSPSEPAWALAAAAVSAAGKVTVGSAVIASRADAVSGSLPAGAWIDIEGQWASSRGVSDGGAVLVRGDNFVAWRSRGPLELGEDADEVLGGVLGRLCGIQG